MTVTKEMLENAIKTFSKAGENGKLVFVARSEQEFQYAMKYFAPRSDVEVVMSKHVPLQKREGT